MMAIVMAVEKIGLGGWLVIGGRGLGGGRGCRGWIRWGWCRVS